MAVSRNRTVGRNMAASTGGGQTRRVTASTYSGTGGGSCGLGLGMTFAELQMGRALGGLACGTDITVTYRGQSAVLKRTDIGLGGPGIGGTQRAIDLYQGTSPTTVQAGTAAAALGLTGPALIVVDVSIGGSPPTTPTGGGGGSSTSAAPINALFRNWVIARDTPVQGSEQGGGFIIGQPTGGAEFIATTSTGPTKSYFANVFAEFVKGGRVNPQMGKHLPQPSLGFDPFAPFEDIANALTSVVRFLQWVGWIFQPVNILRGVEILFGGLMMGFGLHALVQAYGESARGMRHADVLQRSALGRSASRFLERSPVGQTAGRLARRRRGRAAGRFQARSEQRGRQVSEARSEGLRSERRRIQKRENKQANRKLKRRSRGEKPPF